MRGLLVVVAVRFLEVVVTVDGYPRAFVQPHGWLRWRVLLIRDETGEPLGLPDLACYWTRSGARYAAVSRLAGYGATGKVWVWRPGWNQPWRRRYRRSDGPAVLLDADGLPA